MKIKSFASLKDALNDVRYGLVASASQVSEDAASRLAEAAKKAISADVKQRFKRLGANIQKAEKSYRMLKDAALQLEHEYNCAIVKPLPKWADQKTPDEDEVPEMEDEAFARCRARLAQEKDCLKRMAAQVAFANVIGLCICDKEARVLKLSSRIAADADKASPEVVVAQKRIKYIKEMLGVLKKRQYAVVQDFAKTRKLALRQCITCSTKINELMDGDENIAGLLQGDNCNIQRSLELLSEANSALMSEKGVRA